MAPRRLKIPYRLPELLAAEHDTVLIVEGEKDADALAALGFVVTTNAAALKSGQMTLTNIFAGVRSTSYRTTMRLEEARRKGLGKPENDCAHHSGCRLPAWHPKGDVSDWLEAGGTVEGLARLMDGAAPEQARLSRT